MSGDGRIGVTVLFDSSISVWDLELMKVSYKRHPKLWWQLS
jgi:hypothetical protein